MSELKVRKYELANNSAAAFVAAYGLDGFNFDSSVAVPVF